MDKIRREGLLVIFICQLSIQLCQGSNEKITIGEVSRGARAIPIYMQHTHYQRVYPWQRTAMNGFSAKGYMALCQGGTNIGCASYWRTLFRAHHHSKGKISKAFKVRLRLFLENLGIVVVESGMPRVYI